jgi:hypothetical protein
MMTATVSKKKILEEIREALLKSMTCPGWHAVRVTPNGDVYSDLEASPCWSEGEYYGNQPHTVTVWSTSSTGTESDEDVENARESGDWEAWFETNVGDADELAEKLEPTGLALDDDWYPR